MRIQNAPWYNMQKYFRVIFLFFKLNLKIFIVSMFILFPRVLILKIFSLLIIILFIYGILKKKRWLLRSFFWILMNLQEQLLNQNSIHQKILYFFLLFQMGKLKSVIYDLIQIHKKIDRKFLLKGKKLIFEIFFNELLILIFPQMDNMFLRGFLMKYILLIYEKLKNHFLKFYFVIPFLIIRIDFSKKEITFLNLIFQFQIIDQNLSLGFLIPL